MSKSIKMITRNRTSGPKPIDPYHSNKTTGSVGQLILVKRLRLPDSHLLLKNYTKRIMIY
jgi:hypothetical protein